MQKTGSQIAKTGIRNINMKIDMNLGPGGGNMFAATVNWPIAPAIRPMMPTRNSKYKIRTTDFEIFAIRGLFSPQGYAGVLAQ